jgi:hypothetical protein
MIEKVNKTIKYIAFSIWILLSCTVIFSWVGDLIYRHFVINHRKTPFNPVIVPWNTHIWTYIIGIIPILGPIAAKYAFLDRYDTEEGINWYKQKFQKYNTEKEGENITYETYHTDILKQKINSMGETSTGIEVGELPEINSTEYNEGMENDT